MFENLIRLFLLLTLTSLPFIWRFKSPYSLTDWIKTVFTPQGIITISIELLLFLQVLDIIFFDMIDFPGKRSLSVIGLLCYISGYTLAVWAKIVMGTNWGRPAQHEIKKQKKLVITGPFAYSRNPIYVGLLFIFLGIELAIRSYLFFLIIPIFLVVNHAVRTEEKLLEKHFGKEYLDYKKSTPRFILI